MTIKLTEQPDSRAGVGNGDLSSTQSRTWRSTGSSDPAAIITSLKSTAPATITCPVNAITLARHEIRYTPIGFQQYELVVEYSDLTRVNNVAKATAEARDQDLDTGEYTVSFSTLGGTVTLVTSLETVATFVAPGKTAPNFKQSINVNRDGDVQGVAAVVPAMKLVYDYRLPMATVTEAYVATLEAMTGTVNNATWKTRAAGEVLFMGADGRVGKTIDPTLRFEFVRLPNVSGQTIGDILNVAKKGHEFLWAVFEETEDPASKMLRKTPRAVYIERIYPYSDFTALGI